MNVHPDDDREAERADRAALDTWLESGGGAMSTLDLRAAQHAAERDGLPVAARDLAAAVDFREAKGDTG